MKYRRGSGHGYDNGSHVMSNLWLLMKRSRADPVYVNADRREILTNFGDRAVPRSSIFGGFRTTWNRIIVSHRFPSHTARALAPGFDIGLSNNSIHLPFQYRTRMTYSCTKLTSGVQSSVDMPLSCWLCPRCMYIPPRIFYARA